MGIQGKVEVLRYLPTVLQEGKGEHMREKDMGLVVVGCIAAILIVVSSLNPPPPNPPVLQAWNSAGYYEGTASKNLQIESFGAQYWMINWCIIPGESWPEASFSINAGGRVLAKSEDYSGSVWVSFDNMMTFVEIPLKFLPGESASGYLVVEKPEHIEVSVSSNVRWQVYVFVGVMDNPG